MSRALALAALLFVVAAAASAAAPSSILDPACEDLLSRAAKLRNGAANCDAGIASNKMRSCRVEVPFTLAHISGIPDSIMAAPSWQISQDWARKVADQLEAAARLDDGYECRRRGGVGRRPPAASPEDLKAILAKLDAFVNFDRTEMDRDDEWFKKNCPSKCGCPARIGVRGKHCTPDCKGACYQWGGKSGNPAQGVDCSGLILQQNPEFWKDAAGLAKRCPAGKTDCLEKEKTACPDLEEMNVRCSSGTQRQLQYLVDKELNHIENAADLRAGDAAYFSKDGGQVDHVVQIVGDPVCDTNGCKLPIIDSWKTGEPVRQRSIKLDPFDCEVGTTFCFYKGGTPPAPKTGGNR